MLRMEKKIHLYVSRKNVLTWLMALCMVGSAVARIVIPCLKGSGESVNVWSQIVLPVAATALFVYIVLADGKERFYRTAVPVALMGIFYAIRPHEYMNNSLFLGLSFMALFVVAYYIITSGRTRFAWLLIFLFTIPLGILGYFYSGVAIALDDRQKLALLPDALVFAGCFLMTFAVRVHADGKYHPTWGDRSDGRRVRTLAPMAQLTSYFQVERNTCSNLFEESFEITHVERYIRQKRREGLTDFGITHVLLAAYCRGVAKYPQLNRFIAGQKVYSRGNDIQYSMVIKKDMSVESPDTSIKVHLTPYDTADDVYRKLNAAVESVKQTQELDSSFDSLMMALTMIPSVFMKFTVWLLKLLDYFGMLPKFLLELSPFHSSLFLTSMGSLGIKPIYHHLYDFGNLPVFGAFGCKRKALEVQEDGSVVQRKYIDLKFVLDERICDGFYYATFFKHYRRIMRNPEILDNPPEEVLADIP